jgi:hypothetical protein
MNSIIKKTLVKGTMKCENIKRMITLTSDNIRRLSMYTGMMPLGEPLDTSMNNVFVNSWSLLSRNLWDLEFVVVVGRFVTIRRWSTAEI